MGTAVPRRTSGKAGSREASILEGLRQDGLIARPVQQATSGLSFEVVAADLQGDSYLMAKKPPARLAKLEKRAKKKKVLTEEEIKAKMERVERKRQVFAFLLEKFSGLKKCLTASFFKWSFDSQWSCRWHRAF